MDERAIQLLEELRDLVRDQGARQERALALQQAAVANQQRGIRGLRWFVPVFLIFVLSVLLPYFWKLVMYFLDRYGLTQALFKMSSQTDLA